MSRFIDRISSENGIPNGLTVEDLYAYSKNMMFDYWVDNKNKIQLKKAEALAKKLIEIENNERAYNNYLFVLVNSNQFEKAYKQCLSLLNNDKFKYCALKNLSDRVFVDKGLMDKETYIKILQERLSLSKNERDIDYISSILDEEMKS